MGQKQTRCAECEKISYSQSIPFPRDAQGNILDLTSELGVYYTYAVSIPEGVKDWNRYKKYRGGPPYEALNDDDDRIYSLIYSCDRHQLSQKNVPWGVTIHQALRTENKKSQEVYRGPPVRINFNSYKKR